VGGGTQNKLYRVKIYTKLHDDKNSEKAMSQ